MNQTDVQKQAVETARKAALLRLPPITFEELEVIFDKWMIIPDRGILKFIMSLYCTNGLPRKAVWAIIIAPSGGGKTEFLNALLDLTDIYEISMLTTSTFLSGMPGPKDASLLPQINGKVMLFKDWTTILSMQKDARAEIFSQFREIWDGRMRKTFGNGKIRTWVGKVGLIAASTQAVDMNQQQTTHLGERFINYRIIMPDRKEVAMRSLDNDENQEQMVTELKTAVFQFFSQFDFNRETPKLDHAMKVELVNLANFCTMARSGIIRDFGMKKEVVFVPTPEMPTRITQQLSSIATGLMMINGGPLTERDLKIIYKAALDSIPQTNKIVMAEMAKADNQTTAEIATALNYPTEPIRMYLENLALLRVCVRTKEQGRGDRWTMDPEFAELIRHYEEIEELSDDEMADRRLAANNGIDDDVLDDAFDQMGSPE